MPERVITIDDVRDAAAELRLWIPMEKGKYLTRLIEYGLQQMSMRVDLALSFNDLSEYAMELEYELFGDGECETCGLIHDKP